MTLLASLGLCVFLLLFICFYVLILSRLLPVVFTVIIYSHNGYYTSINLLTPHKDWMSPCPMPPSPRATTYLDAFAWIVYSMSSAKEHSERRLFAHTFYSQWPSSIVYTSRQRLCLRTMTTPPAACILCREACWLDLPEEIQSDSQPSHSLRVRRKTKTPRKNIRRAKSRDNSYSFCRAMLCISTASAVMRCLCPSVCLSVRHIRGLCRNE